MAVLVGWGKISMSYSQSASALMQSLHGNGQEKHALLLDASSGHDIVVPGGSFLLTAQFHRSGGDLILVGKDGQEVVVQGYFDSHNPPRLMTEFGAVIDGELAAKLAGPEAGALVAADGNAGQQLQAIGQVQKLSGHAHVKHANGATEDLVQGSTIYKGDVVETEGDGAVGLVFADRSTFSLGKNGRMVMDEMVYDPEAHTGKAAMSVVQGTFSFVSGQIAKSGPDAMSVKTPVMTIGIRGTTVAGTAAAEGSQNTVALLSDEDGGVGQIVVSNASGQTQVLSSPNQTMQLSSSFQAPPAPVVMPASQLHQIMPDLHNVQESRPSQPTADPVIHNNSTGTSSTGTGTTAAAATAATAAATTETTATTTTGKEGTTASGESASGGELNMHTTNATLDAVTSQTTTAVTVAQDNVVASSTSTSTTAVSSASSAGITLQGTSSTAATTTTTTTATTTTATTTTTTAATSTLTTSDSTSTTSTSVTHDSSGNYTLIGGSASTVYAESTAYMTALDAVELGLANSSWTLFAEGNAATVMLSSVTDRVSTVTDHLYAGTGTSGTAADSTSPTLSLANLTAGAFIALSSTAELLMNISNSTDAKHTFADGFHHIVGSSYNDTVYLRDGFYLQLDGGAGTDYLLTTFASAGMTVDLANSLTSGTSVIAATNFENVKGSKFNDLFHLGTQSLTLDGWSGTDTISLDEVSLNSTVNMSSGSVTLSNGAIDIFSNIEVVALGSGSSTITGGTGVETLVGGTGSFTFIGEGGTDSLYLGSAATAVLKLTATGHHDTVYMSNTSASQTVKLTSSDMHNGFAGAANSGDDLVLYYTHAAGDGSTVLKDYFSSTSSATMYISDTDGSREYISHNVTGTAVSATLSGVSNTSWMVLTGVDQTHNMFVVETDYMIVLDSTSHPTGGGMQDFMVEGKGEILIGGSDNNSSAYYNHNTALGGNGITFLMSGADVVTHTLTIQGSTHTLVMSEAIYGGATSYMYGVDEVAGSDNGDLFVGGTANTSSSSGTWDDIKFKAGNGANRIVDISGSSYSNYPRTEVMVDYSGSTAAVTVDLTSTSVLTSIDLTAYGDGIVYRTGTVLHGSSVDYLYGVYGTDGLLHGVQDVIGSAYADYFRLSTSQGSYIQSSKGGDTYYGGGDNSTLDYSDESYALYANLSKGALTLGGVSVAADSVLHYGTTYTDHLYETSGGSDDIVGRIRIGSAGGYLAGDGSTTMDLSQISADMTVNMAAGTVVNSTGTLVHFQSLGAVYSGEHNTTFVLSASDMDNRYSLYGNSGTSYLNVSDIGYHYYYDGANTSYELTNGYVSLVSSDGTAYLYNVTGTLHEFSNADSSYANLDSYQSGHAATIDLTLGTVTYDNGQVYSFAADRFGLYGINGTGLGDFYYGSLSDFNGITFVLEGYNSNVTATTGAMIEVTGNNSTVSDSFFTDGDHGIYDVTEMLMVGSNLSIDLGTDAHDRGLRTLALVADNLDGITANLHDDFVLLVGNDTGSVVIDENAFDNFQGVKDLVVGELRDKDQYLETGDVTVTLGWKADRSADLRTLDLRNVSGDADVTMGGYTGTLTILGSDGADHFTIINSTTGNDTVVLSGDQQDVLKVWGTTADFNVTSLGTSAALVYTSTNTTMVLEGMNQVDMVDGGVTSSLYVIGGASDTANMVVTDGESVTVWEAGVGLLSGTVQIADGASHQYVQLVDGGTTYSLTQMTAYANYELGGVSVGTATMTHDYDIQSGTTLTLKTALALEGNVDADQLNGNAHDLNAYGGTLDLVVGGGSHSGVSVVDGSEINLFSNLTSNTGAFAKISGLDNFADETGLLSLDYSSSAVSLTLHQASVSSETTLTGTSGADYLLGTTTNQTIYGGGGADEIIVHSAPASLVVVDVGDNAFKYLDGGGGTSELKFDFSQTATIDLTGSGVVSAATATDGLHRSDTVENFDMLDLTNSHGSTLKMSELAVYSASKATNLLVAESNSNSDSPANEAYALIIGGNSSDHLTLTDGNWSTKGTVSLTVNGSSHSYSVYYNNTAVEGHHETVYVETGVQVTAAHS